MTEGTIIYNMTVKMDPEIAREFVQWLIDEHLPQMVATGCFTDFKLIRLLGTDEREGPTYAAQLYAPDITSYERFSHDHETAFNKKAFVQWGEQFVVFSTVMQVVK